MPASYLRRLHARAMTDTRHALGIETAQRLTRAVLIPALTAVTIFVLLPYLGSPGATERVYVSLLPLPITFAIFALFYLWNFITAPAKLDREAAAELQRVRGDISESEYSQVTAQIELLDETERLWLYKLLNGEPPNNMPDALWAKVERETVLLHRDGVAKRGIAQRYRGVVAEWFAHQA